MKIAMIALLALACSGTVWAAPIAAPDTGSSAVLLGMGVTVVAFVRGAFKR